jgi:hypothetical protein
VFERRSCGNGTKGPRYGDWALLATADPRELLLIRRLPGREKNHTVLTALAQLRNATVRAAMTGAITLPGTTASVRATPAPAYQDTESPADLQIYRHGAPLPVTGGQPCPPDIRPIELSAPETGRIERLARKYTAGHLSRARLGFHLRWSRWRRRHQARARWHHYSTRLQPMTA